MKRLYLFLLAFLVLPAFAFPAGSHSRRAELVPSFHPGQNFSYLVSYTLNRSITANSSFQTPGQPPARKLALETTLHVEILGHNAKGFHIRTRFGEENSVPPSSSGSAASVPLSSSVEFILGNDGAASSITGLASLPTVQQLAWREWLSRFAASMLYPKHGVKLGEKWDSLEPEAAPSAIAGLVWHRTSQYVRDEPCPEANRDAKGEFLESVSKSETCAVILTSAILKQNSSAKDATPEDYKLNHLKTSGTATGKNQTILYISHSSGLLMRSSETDAQTMNVTVALADGSNQVHYDMTASSRARLLLISSAPNSPH